MDTGRAELLVTTTLALMDFPEVTARTGSMSRSVIGECGVVANDWAIGTAPAKAQIKPKATILMDDRMPRAGEP
jgi:hypothetical protein